MTAAELPPLLSDITALRSVVKLLDCLAEDYRHCLPICDNLKSASTHAAYALEALRKRLPKERPAK